MTYDERKRAERHAFRMVPETCPEVDAAVAAMTKTIKDCTTTLREALIDALVEVDRLESKVADLEAQLADQERRIAELEG